MLVNTPTIVDDQDRTEQYATVAQQRADGEVTVPPLLLPAHERRLHVRRTLREDHQFRINNRPEGAQRKFDKLADDVYDFFRGTALLFYRDHAGMDGHLPVVFTIGDAHPGNFGVMPNEDNAPFFGVNDFDEAIYAPFSFDVKRCAVGFYLASLENGFKKKHAKKVVKAWVRGYIDGLREFMQDDREKWHQFRIDNSPDMIRELLEEAIESRPSFLEDKIDFETRRFLPTDEILPYSKHVEEFQEVVDGYVKQNETRTDDMADDFFRVRDVAIKLDSGTASLGLQRYWVLIQGQRDDVSEHIILEMKQTRRSALYKLVPEVEADNKGDVAQVVRAQKIHLAGGDRFYGEAEYNDQSYLVRERSPFKDDIDVDELDEEEMQTYARICGKALAQTHARSDEDIDDTMDGDGEVRILAHIEPKLFEGDVVRFARASVKRIYRDWKLFKKDHKHGAYRFVGSGE